MNNICEGPHNRNTEERNAQQYNVKHSYTERICQPYPPTVHHTGVWVHFTVGHTNVHLAFLLIDNKKKIKNSVLHCKKKYFFEIVNKSWLEKKILIQFFYYKIAHLIQSYLLFLCYCLWNELAISECRLFIHQIVFIVVQNVKMESVK